MIRIPLDQIGYDQAFHCRNARTADWVTAHVYAEALQVSPWKANPRRKKSFPPIVVVRATGFPFPYLLIDGLFRIKAWKGAKLETIPAVVENIPQSQWLKRSAELNLEGKRALSADDKRWVAANLKADGWQLETIAEFLLMKEPSFKKLMATNIELLTAKATETLPAGRSNRLINGKHVGFLKAPFSKSSGTRSAMAALAVQEHVAGRDAAQIVESFIALLEGKAIDLKDKKLCARMKHARKLLTAYLK